MKKILFVLFCLLSTTIANSQEGPDIFFSETFENWDVASGALIPADTVMNRWQPVLPNYYSSNQSMTTYTGHGKVFKSRYTAGQGGTSKGLESNPLLGTVIDEIWTEVECYFDPGWYDAATDGTDICTGKFPLGGAIGGRHWLDKEYGGGTWALDTVGDYNATNGWAAHSVWGSPESGINRIWAYLYDQTQTDGAGGHTYNGDIPYMKVTRGEWHRYTFRIKLNTPGKYDGILERYKDGVMNIQDSTIMYRSLDQANRGLNGIEGIILKYAFGGGSSSISSRTNYVLFDNIVAYTWPTTSSHYLPGPNHSGTIPQVSGTITSTIYPDRVLKNETYTATSGTIKSHTNGGSFVPYSKTTYTKTITGQTNPFKIKFTRWHDGFNETDDKECWVKIYTGTGTGKTRIKWYQEAGEYNGVPTIGSELSIAATSATIEYCTGRDLNMGWALDYYPSGTLPTVSISATDANAAEQSQDTGTFTISRGTATSGNLTVNYTVGGTATSADYTQTLTGSVTISDGNSTATITITPVDDSTEEDDPETVILTLASGTGYTVETPSSATVNIADNDGTEETIASINFTASGSVESGWTSVYGSASSPVDLGDGLTLTISGNTLSSGVNGEPTTMFPSNVGSTYNFLSNAINTTTLFRISGLDTSKTYSFDFFESRDDASASGDRTATFTIGSTSVGVNPIGNTGSLLTISNISPNSSGIVDVTMSKIDGQYGYINAMIIRTSVESDPEVSITATDATAAEQGPDTGTFTISRGTATSGNLTVNYTIGGTASSGDYTPTLTGSVTIADGNSTAAITITPVDDSTNEDDPETVTLTLTSGTGYTVGAPSSATINIADNDIEITLQKTILINTSPSGYPGGTGWNDFTSYSAGSSKSLLIDSITNLATTYSIYNEDTWYGNGKGGMTTGPYPDNVNKTYWTINQGTTKNIEFRNLNNSSYYSLEFYGSRNMSTETRAISVTIGSNTDYCTVCTLGVGGNTTDKAYFSNIQPSAGTIRADITVSTGGYGYLNAIILREYNGLKSAKISTFSQVISADGEAPFVYPNPFNDVLRVGNTEKIIRAEITDVSGKAIIVKQNAQSPDMKIGTRSLKSGIYVIRLLDDAGKVSTFKVVKKNSR